MSMPKAPVNKNDSMIFRQHYIGVVTPPFVTEEFPVTVPVRMCK